MIEVSNHKFAAFVITKDRPDTLFLTVQKLLSQSLPPSFILVIDNGFQDLTFERINQLNDDRISHHFVGFNSGPAGGAYWGMKLLFERGYDWVLWVDDDDPPRFTDLIEDLFKIIHYNDDESLGMVGSVGELFNKQKAKLVRLRDDQLKGYLDVDSISGNMFPLVSKRVYKQGLLPSLHLFFGFEDLDFSLSIKRTGMRILISGELHLKHRILVGRTDLKKTFHKKRLKESLWREYYSVRSLSYIMLYREKNLIGFFSIVFRNSMKSIFVFKYGLIYGILASSMILRGLMDGMLGRMGMRISPVSKQLIS